MLAPPAECEPAELCPPFPPSEAKTVELFFYPRSARCRSACVDVVIRRPIGQKKHIGHNGVIAACAASGRQSAVAGAPGAYALNLVCEAARAVLVGVPVSRNREAGPAARGGQVDIRQA